jgi:hypothetical protein
MERFATEEFWRFCARLTINSKEMGAVRLSRPYGPQRWIVREMARAFDSDIHDFTILKCRQLGASTVMLALDLFWLWTHPGTDGTLVTHDEGTFVNFRTQLSEFYNHLPRTYKPFAVTHNRNEYVWRFSDNRMSRLQYQIAGTRMGQSVKLGRAKGNAFCHGTEVGYWADQGAFQSLKNSLAEKNPSRLFVWESTANGFNGWEEQWRIANRAMTQKAIFVSWWAHELYRLKRDSRLFEVYWGEGGRMTAEERKLARDVALLYGDCLEYLYGTKELQPEQIAWYRWYSEEKVADPDMAKQEMPWTADTAFVTTGAQFFQSKDLTATMRRIVGEVPPRTLRVEIQHRLEDTLILEAPKKVSNLLLYAGPEARGRYVLGADPAYGSSDWADAFCISVWRVWYDRAEQVAEFHDANFQPYAFAWVMCYLAGMYAPCAWNLEITGPGAAVLGEIDNLKRQRFGGALRDRALMKNFLGGMQEFLYTRFDAINKNPVARGTQSTYKEKNRYMDTYKDYYTRNLIVPHSRRLIDEMRWITREVGHAPSGSSRHKDDTVVAAALAVQMWHDKLRHRLLAENVSWVAEQKVAAGASPIVSVYDQFAERQRRILGMTGPGGVNSGAVGASSVSSHRTGAGTVSLPYSHSYRSRPLRHPRRRF